MPFQSVNISYTVNPPRPDILEPAASRGEPELLVYARTDVGESKSPLPGVTGPGVTGNDVATLLENAARIFDAGQGNAMVGMSKTALDVVHALEGVVSEGPQPQSEHSAPKTQASAIARDATEFIQHRQQKQAGVALTASERANAVLEFAMRIIRNDFEGDFGRWSANCINTCVRTGLIVAIAATIRQLIGFLIEKSLLLGDAPVLSRDILTASAVLAAPAMNVVGMLRDCRNQTATTASQLSRLVLLLTAIGCLLATTVIEGPSTTITPYTSAMGVPVVMSSIAAMACQMTSYTVARDLFQIFMPTARNVDGSSSGSLERFSPQTAAVALIASTAYAGGQFALGEAANALAPSSGPGRVTAAAREACVGAGAERLLDGVAHALPADSSTSQYAASTDDPISITKRVHSAVDAVQPDFAQDFTRATLVAAGEVADDLMFGYVARARQVSQEKERVRQQALAAGADPEAALANLPKEVTGGLRVRLELGIPTYEQFARQITTTNPVRNCAIQTATMASACAAAALSRSSLTTPVQDHLVNMVGAACIWLTYLPFIYAHEQASER